MAARVAEGRRRLRVGGRRGRGVTGAALPDARSGLHRPAAPSPPRIRRAALGGSRRGRRRPGVAADDRRGNDPRRASAPGRGTGLGRQRRHQPAPVQRRSTGRNTSSRSAWSSRCCSGIRRAPTPGWTSSAAISSGGRSRSLRTPSGEAQVRVALKAVESARQAAAAGSAADRAAHVGYHLSIAGRADLEADLAYRPCAAVNGSGACSLRHASGFYLGAIALLTALLVAAACSRTRGSTARLRPSRRSLPSCCAAAGQRPRRSACCSRPSCGSVEPRRLPRLDFSKGVPETSPGPWSSCRRC